jgi:hypothetical protein
MKGEALRKSKGRTGLEGVTPRPGLTTRLLCTASRHISMTREESSNLQSILYFLFAICEKTAESDAGKVNNHRRISRLFSRFAIATRNNSSRRPSFACSMAALPVKNITLLKY